MGAILFIIINGWLINRNLLGKNTVSIVSLDLSF